MQFGRLSMRRSQLLLTLALASASMMLLAGPALANPSGGEKPQSSIASQVKKPPPPLTATWWQSFMRLSGGSGDLARCDIGTADVVFLAGTTGGSDVRSCTISSKKSILVPLINAECSVLEGDGTTPAELRACARHKFADNFTNFTLTIDGVPVPNLTEFRVGSPVFTFTAVDNNPFGTIAKEPAVLPGTTHAVADGYWALIPPLPAGTHTITFGGEAPAFDFKTQATYTLTVK